MLINCNIGNLYPNYICENTHLKHQNMATVNYPRQLKQTEFVWLLMTAINLLNSGACIPMLPPEMEDYIIHWSISLISPVIIIIIAFIISIPRSITNRICNRIGKHKQDITLLRDVAFSVIKQNWKKKFYKKNYHK